MKSTKRLENVGKRLRILSLGVSLLLAASCAKGVSLVEYQRPEYQLKNLSDIELEVAEEISLECLDLFPNGDEEVLYLCEEQLIASDAYWDAVGVIAEYEAIDIWDDDLAWKKRPANYLLLR